MICFNSNGSVAYPSSSIRTAADAADHRQDWIEARALDHRAGVHGAAEAYAHIAEAEHLSSLKARALQAQVRCLLRAGETRAAIRVIRDRLTKGQPPAGLIAKPG